MSISALSSNLVNDLSQQQNPLRQIRQDFNQLASALQAGDLSGAQSAFSSLHQLLQGQQTGSNASSNGPSTIQSDFAALGQALQSGDLNQAQGAFSQLQNDIQTAQHAAGSPGQSLTQGLQAAVKGHHHHHHHGGGDPDSQSSTSTTASTNSFTASNTSSSVNLYA